MAVLRALLGPTRVLESLLGFGFLGAYLQVRLA